MQLSVQVLYISLPACQLLYRGPFGSDYPAATGAGIQDLGFTKDTWGVVRHRTRLVNVTLGIEGRRRELQKVRRGPRKVQPVQGILGSL